MTGRRLVPTDYIPEFDDANAHIGRTKRMSNATEIIRATIRKLDPAGAGGFEGLLAVALEEVVDVPFRLAAPGAQYGVDGLPVYSTDSVTFEAKRYDDAVPRDKVLVKIQDIALRPNGKDLWILGATTSVSAQLASDIHAAATNAGIAAVILDWNEVSLPPLAVVLAIAEESVVDFLSANSGIKDLSELRKAISELREEENFDAHADRIKSELNQATVGAPVAMRFNRLWLRDKFSSSKRARQYFRQSVAPGDASGTTLDRVDLANKVSEHFEAAPDGTVLLVAGGEGSGKSWLVAKTWLDLDAPPLTLFLPAESVPSDYNANSIQEFIIKEIIQQTSGDFSETSFKRWNRILSRWKNIKVQAAPTLVAVIDGINQRPEQDWPRVVDSLNEELKKIGGKLIVTSRTEYFDLRVRRRLIDPHVTLIVPEWTGQERNQILKLHGVSSEVISSSVAKSLRNPRVLAITLKLFDKTSVESLTELTVTRLLFEYLRFQEIEAPTPLPADEFAKKLQGLAKEVIHRKQAKISEDLTVFQGGIDAVSGGLFFSPIPGDASRYSLKEDGLDLALGFALVDVALHASRNQLDIPEKLAALLDPITALDRSANALFAALTIVCIDEIYNDDIRASFVEALVSLQNVDGALYAPFCQIARTRIEAFLVAVARRAQKPSRLSHGDWLRPSLLAAADVASAWNRIKPVVSAWLRTYSLAARPRYLPRNLSSVERNAKFDEARQVVGDRLGKLTEAEGRLLSLMTQEDSTDTAELAELSLLMMAGKPLAEFAFDLVAWRFGSAINPSFDDPHTLFAQLVRHSAVDWAETRQALLAVCAPLRVNPSYCGSRTLHDVLSAIGDLDDAIDAESIYKGLTQEQPPRVAFGRFSGICSPDPCDPASHDADIRETARRYSAIDVAGLRRQLGLTDSDYNLERSIPLKRYQSKIETDVPANAV